MLLTDNRAIMRKDTASNSAICAEIILTLQYNPPTGIVMDNPLDKLSQLRGKKPLSVNNVSTAETTLSKKKIRIGRITKTDNGEKNKRIFCLLITNHDMQEIFNSILQDNVIHL